MTTLSPDQHQAVVERTFLHNVNVTYRDSSFAAGDREMVECPECRGSGRLASGFKHCHTCHGTGRVPKPAAGGSVMDQDADTAGRDERIRLRDSIAVRYPFAVDTIQSALDQYDYELSRLGVFTCPRDGGSVMDQTADTAEQDVARGDSVTISREELHDAIAAAMVVMDEDAEDPSIEFTSDVWHMLTTPTETTDPTPTNAGTLPSRDAVEMAVKDEMRLLSFHRPLSDKDTPYTSGKSINQIAGRIADAVMRLIGEGE